MTEKKHYDKTRRERAELSELIFAHQMAMTGEDLHGKSEIAAEFAHRDYELSRSCRSVSDTDAELFFANIDYELLAEQKSALARAVSIEQMRAGLGNTNGFDFRLLRGILIMIDNMQDVAERGMQLHSAIAAAATQG